MIEWLAEQLIMGTPNNVNEPLTYVEAVQIIRDITTDDKYEESKKELDTILITKGYVHLIKK